MKREISRDLGGAELGRNSIFTAGCDYSCICIQGVKKLRLQRFRDDRGGKNKHFFSVVSFLKKKKDL